MAEGIISYLYSKAQHVSTSVHSYFSNESVLVCGKPSRIRPRSHKLTKASYTLAPTVLLIALLLIELIFPRDTAFTESSVEPTYFPPVSDNIPQVTVFYPEITAQEETYEEFTAEDTVYEYVQEQPTPTAAPIITPLPISTGGLNADHLFNLVNNHRISRGLPPFEKEGRLCEVAQSRAPEIRGEITNGTLHSGLRNRGLPYRVYENAIWMSSEERAFAWWMNSGIHRASIEGNYKYSCTSCHENACVQLFSNFEAK